MYLSNFQTLLVVLNGKLKNIKTAILPRRQCANYVRYQKEWEEQIRAMVGA
jgi:hypothetical protein